ncbi:MAG: hypothetical protein A2W19_02785 [Spirochaetes bacterium RBG_16_49_21]|nr:MAG: hypothetical protein A2W19_02785 [Spirochaetes bacterium RBG_16_49_21]
MSLITEAIKEKAAICKRCIVQRMRGSAGQYLDDKLKMAGRGVFDRDTAKMMNKFSRIVVENAAKVACNTCPNRKYFEKIYGMSPYEYYAKNRGRIKNN